MIIGPLTRIYAVWGAFDLIDDTLASPATKESPTYTILLYNTLYAFGLSSFFYLFTDNTMHLQLKDILFVAS